jgi:hypothetical protein
MDSTRAATPPQESPATPGSRSATVTIDGKQLPPPPMKFGGVIGCDTRTPVDDSYEVPFQFTGKIDRLTFKLGPEQLMEADHAAKAEALASLHS